MVGERTEEEERRMAEGGESWIIYNNKKITSSLKGHALFTMIKLLLNVPLKFFCS